MRACLIILLIISLFCPPVGAATLEAKVPNFWQEFDITFWQTMPFAAFWGYTIGTQLSHGGAVDWNFILAISAGVSAANAWAHAGKTISAHSPSSR